MKLPLQLLCRWSHTYIIRIYRISLNTSGRYYCSHITELQFRGRNCCACPHRQCLLWLTFSCSKTYSLMTRSHGMYWIPHILRIRTCTCPYGISRLSTRIALAQMRVQFDGQELLCLNKVFMRVQFEG